MMVLLHLAATRVKCAKRTTWNADAFDKLSWGREENQGAFVNQNNQNQGGQQNQQGGQGGQQGGQQDQKPGQQTQNPGQGGQQGGQSDKPGQQSPAQK
jgi:hypothetical protein